MAVPGIRLDMTMSRVEVGSIFLVSLCKSEEPYSGAPDKPSFMFHWPQFGQMLLPKTVTSKENGITTVALD